MKSRRLEYYGIFALYRPSSGGWTWCGNLGQYVDIREMKSRFDLETSDEADEALRKIKNRKNGTSIKNNLNRRITLSL